MISLELKILQSMGDYTSCAIAEDGTLLSPELSAEDLAEFNRRVAAEVPMANLRRKRDLLLAKTDWWASSDRTITTEEIAYRQALRDLPANTTDPTNPTWPTKP
jgi:hypothetical protein